MQEKTDEYLTTEAIDLDHLENKSKTCKWASAFIMEVPVKFSCSHPQKTQPQYTTNVCVSISNNTFALIYNKLHFFLSKEAAFLINYNLILLWCLGTWKAWRILIPTVLFSTLLACLILRKILMNSFKQSLDTPLGNTLPIPLLVQAHVDEHENVAALEVINVVLLS